MRGVPEVPAPDEDVWFFGLRWIEAAHMSAQRFEDAFREFERALLEADMRERLDGEIDNDADWRAHYDTYEQFDPARPIRVPTVALHMQFTSERDFLMVSVRNVLRAYDRLPETSRPTMTGQDALLLMRNVAEHWDDIDGPSFRKLAERHPTVDERTMTTTNKEIVFGGADGVPLSRIREWLMRMESALHSALDNAGRKYPPDLDASVVAGDDELAWPPERLRFHWAIPIVDETEWPREELPPEVLDLLAQRFLNQRERDGGL